MAKDRVLLTPVEEGVRLHSNVHVYDAQTRQLKRIEEPNGKVLVDYIGKKSEFRDSRR